MNGLNAIRLIKLLALKALFLIRIFYVAPATASLTMPLFVFELKTK